MSFSIHTARDLNTLTLVIHIFMTSYHMAATPLTLFRPALMRSTFCRSVWSSRQAPFSSFDHFPCLAGCPWACRIGQSDLHTPESSLHCRDPNLEASYTSAWRIGKSDPRTPGSTLHSWNCSARMQRNGQGNLRWEYDTCSTSNQP